MNIYQGWKYNFGTQTSPNWEIVPDNSINIPKTFYKYYSISQNSVDALTNLYVYATHPYQLNDPFDCNPLIIRIDDEENLHNLYNLIPDGYNKLLKEYGSIKSLYELAPSVFSTLLFRHCGILSLTSDNKSMQMWALYAQNSGFCVEWDIGQFHFLKHGPYPIHYCEKIEPIKTSSGWCIADAALLQTNVKNIEWKYEKEWRLLISNPEGICMKTYGPMAEQLNQIGDHDRKFRYPISALKSITLGPHFFRELYDNQQCFYINNEMRVIYKNHCLQTMILDFINEVTKKTSLKVLIIERNEINTIVPIHVNIIKLKDWIYNIVEI